MAAKKALGRGFDSLIPSELLDESFDPTAGQDGQISELRQLKISQISADPDQPRRHFDETALAELAASVAEHGVVQPIVVTPRKSGYIIVAGERRYRAAKAAGLDKIPALVRTLTAQHKLELSLIENLQRQDLNVLETATAYLKLRDQFNLTMEQIGQKVGGKSSSTINNTLRLLRLPNAVKEAIMAGKLSEGQARPLVNVEQELVLKLLPQIIQENWSARRVEAAIAGLKNGQKPAAAPVHKYQKEAQSLTESLSAKVKVSTTKRGSGSISIAFKNKADLERLLKLLG